MSIESYAAIKCCVCGKKGYLNFSKHISKENQELIVNQSHFCILCEGTEDDIHYDKPLVTK